MRDGDLQGEPNMAHLFTHFRHHDLLPSRLHSLWFGSFHLRIFVHVFLSGVWFVWRETKTDRLSIIWRLHSLIYAPMIILSLCSDSGFVLFHLRICVHAFLSGVWFLWWMPAEIRQASSCSTHQDRHEERRKARLTGRLTTRVTSGKRGWGKAGIMTWWRRVFLSGDGFYDACLRTYSK